MNQCSPTAQLGGGAISATMDALRERGDHYTLANMGLGHLDNDPNDVPVRLMVCQSYLTLGLFGPARDLLRGINDAGGLSPEMTAMGERINQMPSGRVAWSSLQRRFEANVTRLFERFPDMRAHDAVFRGIPRRYELYRTLDGNHHLAGKTPDGRRRWVPDLCNVQGAVARAKLPHDPKALFCGPYLVAGDRFGVLFDRVFTATQKMFLTFTPRIYVVETDVVAFGATLYLLASMDRLCHERSVVLVGPDGVDQLAAHLESHPTRHAPEYTVGLTTQSAAVSDKVLKLLEPRAKVFEQRTLAAQEAVRRTYEPRSIAHWRDRFRPDRTEPLRVLGLTGRFTTYLQYSMRDWGAAFEARGHEFRMILEESDHDLLPPFRIPEVVQRFDPDLVVCIDHFRHEYLDKVPANVPFVGWVQDALPHLYCRPCGESLGRLDYYIERDAHLLARRYGYPASRGITWPMVTNERLFSHEPMVEENLAPHRCDFSFVSNQSKLPKHLHQERREAFKSDPAALRLVDCLFEALLQIHHIQPQHACLALRRLYADARKETGAAPNSPETEDLIFTAYLYPMSDLIFRQHTLAWIADYCDRTGRILKVYGNGWEEHPRFGRYACGFARNGQDLRAIYQAAAINLQITSYGAVHQRMLDGLAAGGFFLIRESPGDTGHDLAERLLAAARKYDARPDTPYAFGEMPELEEAMNELWARYLLHPPQDCFVIPADFFHRFEALEAGGFDQMAGAVFAQYPRVSFDSAARFNELADHYLANEGERRAIARAMRAVVVEKYTYDGLVDSVLSFIGNDLMDAGGGREGRA